MKELVEVLAKSLVDYPEQVTVTETEQDNEILLVLKVASDDMGKLLENRDALQKQYVLW